MSHPQCWRKWSCPYLPTELSKTSAFSPLNGGEEEDEGVWDRLGPDVQIDREHSQVRFRVTIGGRTAEIVADTLLP